MQKIEYLWFLNTVKNQKIPGCEEVNLFTEKLSYPKQF